MKYLAILFTIYIMALSAWPCCADETGLSSSHEDLCLGTSAHQDDSHDKAHACSPFFHANTYHAFVASPSVSKPPLLVTAENSSSYPEYEDVPVSLFPGDIWQPPQWV